MGTDCPKTMKHAVPPHARVRFYTMHRQQCCSLKYNVGISRISIHYINVFNKLLLLKIFMNFKLFIFKYFVIYLSYLIKKKLVMVVCTLFQHPFIITPFIISLQNYYQKLNYNIYFCYSEGGGV